MLLDPSGLRASDVNSALRLISPQSRGTAQFSPSPLVGVRVWIRWTPWTG